MLLHFKIWSRCVVLNSLQFYEKKLESKSALMLLIFDTTQVKTEIACNAAFGSEKGSVLFCCRDGSFLLTASGDGTARVFTVQTPGRWSSK